MIEPTIEPRPTDEEAAAVLAAISWYLAQQEEQSEKVPYDWHWSASAALIIQGLRPMRSPLRPAWNSVERLRRAGQGGTGITGL